MKTIKLNKLQAHQLANREMKKINGGDAVSCGCGCCYSGNGGSSTYDNGTANSAGGKYSPGCPNTLF